MKKKKLIVITGPTASGKSALAVSVAKKLGTEIVSADSRQIYQGIPIVTAVPSEHERGNIPHHLLEILPLDSYYSASRFQEDAEKIIHKVFQDKDKVVVCGGSMLYIDALVNGIDELPTVPEVIRQDLMSKWKEKGDEWLLQQLLNYDPAYYNIIDHRNLKRVFHAVEVSLTAGQPYTSLLTGRDKKRNLPFEVLKFCLTGEREKLFEKINNRVEKMIEMGLEKEARSVYPKRYLNSLNTVGLKEMFAYFDGNLNFSEAVARIQKNTRVYAKKQMTWHKRDNDIIYLDFSDTNHYNTEKILSF